MHIVQAIDVQTHHDRAYVARRSINNDNIWDVLCFSNPCMVLTAEGMREAAPGDCFIRAPGFLEYHYTPECCQEGFINDWMHVESDGMESFLLFLRLPVNTLIPTRQPGLLQSSMQRIMNERRDRQPFYEENIHNLVEHALIKIGRAAAEASAPGNSRKYEEALKKLRLKIYESLDRQWSNREMARELGVSLSRFSALYKERFGQSPNEDLIQMRIEKAKILLLSTDLKLQSIALMCGYKNEYYFSRVFKERENMTPGGFRREG